MSSIKQLEDIIYSANQLNKSLLDDLLTLKEDKKLTNTQLNVALTAKEKAERKYAKVKEEIEVLKKRAEDFEAKCSELEGEIAGLQDRDQDASEKITELGTRRSELEETVDRMARALESAERTLAEEREKNRDSDALRRELDEWRERTRALEKEKEKFDKTRAEIEKRRVEAEKYAVGLETRANELENILSANESSLKEVKDLSKKNKELEKELMDYQRLLKNEQSNREQIEEELESKIKKLKQEIQVLKENEENDNTVPESTTPPPPSSNVDYKVEYNKLLKKNEELTLVNQTLDSKIDEFLKKYESEKKLRSKLEDQFLNLQSQFNNQQQTNLSTIQSILPSQKLQSFSSFFSRNSPLKLSNSNLQEGAVSNSEHDVSTTTTQINDDSNSNTSNFSETEDELVNQHMNQQNHSGTTTNTNNSEVSSPPLSPSGSTHSSLIDESASTGNSSIGVERKNKIFKVYQDMLVECNTLLYEKQEQLADLEKIGGLRKLFLITSLKTSISKIEPMQEAIKRNLIQVDSKPSLSIGEEQHELNRIKILQTDLDEEK